MYVLIVDDAKPKKEMLRMMLEKIFHNEQIHLSWATNFIDAQNRFQNRDAYSIILLDGDLKDIRGNGVDLIPFIREKLWLAGATIIMTTYDERLRTAANKAGVPLFITPQDCEDFVVYDKELPNDIVQVFNKFKLEMSHSSH
jgi:DNA-binding response OmpR family regulator